MKKLSSKFLQKIFSLLARICIARHKPFVIGVTGSFGKTTARHVITEILRRANRDVWSPEGNYNGEWWLAFAVLQIRGGKMWFVKILKMFLASFKTILAQRYPAILVLEYGVDHAGEMKKQTDVVEPDIALFTQLSASHTEGFGGDPDRYYFEKSLLLSRQKKHTFAIGNNDDPHQINFSCQIWYGRDSSSELGIGEVVEHPDGIEFDISFEKKSYHIVSPILGSHHAGLLAGAFLVTHKMDIPLLDAIAFLRHIHLPHARGNVLKWINDSLIIDGTYNGWFEPIVAGVEMLVRLAQSHGRKTIALLGDMRELGALERVRHEELWEVLQTFPIDYYVFVGAVCMEVIRPRVHGKWAEKTFFTLDSRAAGEYIQWILSTDQDPYYLFAKGSQNTIYLEEALKYFIFPEEYLKLTRQDDLYLEKKRHFFGRHLKK